MQAGGCFFRSLLVRQFDAGARRPRQRVGPDDRFTFSQPVEVPGRVLPAGSYWFQLLDSTSNRRTVLIYNGDQTELSTIILAAPAWRYRPTDRTELTFAERPHDRPEAILTWYYPGLRSGLEFVYPSHAQKHLERSTTEELLLPQADSDGRPTVIVRLGE